MGFGHPKIHLDAHFTHCNLDPTVYYEQFFNKSTTS